jgi:hypothetical protein
LHEPVNDLAASRVHVEIDTTVPLGGYAFHTLCGACGPKLLLEFCSALVIELVDRLDWPAVNDYWNTSRFV